MMEQFISKVAEDPTKLVTLLIALAALIISIVSFILNRQHATRLFKAKAYPEILLKDFRIFLPSLYLIPVLRHGSNHLWHRDIATRETVNHRAFLSIDLENVTEVKALDLYARIALSKGLRRVRWCMRKSSWKIMPPLTADGAGFSETFHKALIELCPNKFIRRDLGNGPNSEYRWLELREGARVPRIAVLMEVGWRPPLTGAASESRVVAGILIPELLQEQLKPEFDTFSNEVGTPIDLIGRPVIGWKYAQRRFSTFLKVMYWRPRTSELPDEERT